MDLAGVRPKDLVIQFHGRHLEVHGLRRDLSLVRGHQAYSMEIAYNRFHRTIELPCDIDHSTVQSEYQDGMLLIMVGTRGPDA